MILWQLRLAFGLTLITMSLYAIAEERLDVVIYGESAYPPYAWMNDGEFEGIYVDIINKAAERMEEYNVILKSVPWERGLYLLEQGEAFALFPPYYYSDRRAYIFPYSTPILTEKTVLICRDEIFTEDRQHWPDDYLGLTIGVNSGYLVGGKAFLSAVEQGKIFLSESIQAKQNLLMVATGRIDCYINDELAIKLEINKLKKSDSYIEELNKLSIGPVISVENGYLGYSNKGNWRYPYKDKFVIKFNEIINDMKQNGEIDLIIKQYIESSTP